MGLKITGVHHKEGAYTQGNPGSLQLWEFWAVLKVLEMTQSEPVNIFSDSPFVTQSFKTLSFANLKSLKDSISKTLQTIQELLQSRE